jgi:hypothetical protein
MTDLDTNSVDLAISRLLEVEAHAEQNQQFALDGLPVRAQQIWRDAEPTDNEAYTYDRAVHRCVEALSEADAEAAKAAANVGSSPARIAAALARIRAIDQFAGANEEFATGSAVKAQDIWGRHGDYVHDVDDFTYRTAVRHTLRNLAPAEAAAARRSVGME